MSIGYEAIRGSEYYVFYNDTAPHGGAQRDPAVHPQRRRGDGLHPGRLRRSPAGRRATRTSSLSRSSSSRASPTSPTDVGACAHAARGGRVPRGARAAVGRDAAARRLRRTTRRHRSPSGRPLVRRGIATGPARSLRAPLERLGLAGRGRVDRRGWADGLVAERRGRRRLDLRSRCSRTAGSSPSWPPPAQTCTAPPPDRRPNLCGRARPSSSSTPRGPRCSGSQAKRTFVLPPAGARTRSATARGASALRATSSPVISGS